MTEDTNRVERMDVIRAEAGRAGYDVIEHGINPPELLLLKPAEARILAEAVIIEGDGVDAPVRAALEDLGRLRAKRLEQLVAPLDVATIRRRLLAELESALESLESERSDFERVGVAGTVASIATAYEALRGDEPILTEAKLAVGNGQPLYERMEIWRTISELPGLDNATTIADDVVTRLAARDAEALGEAAPR